MATQKYQHYVPQTYLSKWLDGNKQLHLYNKENELIRSCKTDRVFGENNLYTKSISYLLVCNIKEKTEIFKCLDGYRVFLGEKQLLSIESFASNYYLFDEWIIKDRLGNIRSKNKFRSEIEHSRILTIENLLKKFEDEWNDIYETLINLIDNYTNEDIVNDFVKNCLDKLKKIIFIQQWRNKDKVEFYNDAINKSIGFMKEEMGKVYDKIIEEFPKTMFLQDLENFLVGSKESFIDKNFKKFKMAEMKIFIATGNKKFLTNDNPILYVDNKKLDWGIYYPISPKIVCCFIKGDKNKISIEQMPFNSIRELNKIIKKDANEFYISSEVR